MINKKKHGAHSTGKWSIKRTTIYRTLTREKRQLSLRAKNNLHLQLEWIIEIAVFQNSCAFSGVFSWKRLKMAIYKLYILILEFSKERIETIFRSIGVAVQDLADFSFIFSHIWIAYISRTKPSIKNLFDKFWGLNMSSEPVKFCENRISSFREKRVTD